MRHIYIFLPYPSILWRCFFYFCEVKERDKEYMETNDKNDDNWLDNFDCIEEEIEGSELSLIDKQPKMNIVVKKSPMKKLCILGALFWYTLENIIFIAIY